MIRFALRCEAGHAFDAWFASGGAFDDQQRRGLVACAVCGSAKVEKALMAPAVRAERKAEPVDLVKADPRAAAFREMLREVRRQVLANSEDVGDKFPEEARRIHYEEAPERSIYGKASPEEATALHEEGIEVHPLPPPLPEERN